MSSAYQIGQDMAQQHILRDNPEATLYPKSYITPSSFITGTLLIQLIESIAFLMVLSLAIYCVIKLVMILTKQIIKLSRNNSSLYSSSTSSLPLHNEEKSIHGLGFSTPPGLSFSPNNSPVMSPDDMSCRITTNHLTNRRTNFSKAELGSPLDTIRPSSHIVYS